MSNDYTLNLSDGSVDLIVPEKQAVFDHGLTFTGRGVVDYGQSRNTNLLHLLEHFASDTPPANPLAGQIWYNTASNLIEIWNGVAWTTVASDDFILGTGEGSIVGPYVVASNEANLVKSIADPTSNITLDNIAEYADLQDHISGTGFNHDADVIDFDDTGLPITASNTQDAIEAINTYLLNHIASTSAHAATAISFDDDDVSFVANDVQEAIEDLDTRRSGASTTATNVNANVNSHITDATAAHAADAISYDNTLSGLTATNVQDAIDEIATDIITGSASGYVDCVRTELSAGQLITTGVLNSIPPWTKLQFDTIVFGDDLNNFNTGLNRYVADRDMEVRIRAYVKVELGNNQDIHIRVLKNGATVLRQGATVKQSSSITLATTTVEISVIDEIDDTDYIEIEAAIETRLAPATNRTIVSGRANTGFEIEVLKEL